MGLELRPLAAISLCYIAGIALGRLWLEAPLWAVLLPGLLLIIAGWSFWKGRLSLFAALLLMVTAAAGAAAFFVSFYPRSAGERVLDYAGRPLYVEGTILEEPLQYDDHTAYVLQVDTVQTAEGRRDLAGKLLVKIYGDEQALYRFGEKLRLRGTIIEPKGRRVPGGFDYAFYLRSQGIDGLVYPKAVQVSSLGDGDLGQIATSAVALRSRMTGVIDKNLPSPAAELLAGILFGQRSRLPEDIQENFTSSGVGHLLAVSGLHVGLVAALILGLWRCLGLQGKLPFAITIALVFGYAYLTGMRPSALRAAVMLSFALGALLLERERDLPTAVAMAALITLVLNPLNLFTIGFQLSYAATLAIIYLQPPLAELARNLGLPKFIRPILTVTLAAQIGVLPLCAYYFQHIPLGALLFNLVLLPLMSPVVGLGLGGALLGFILPVAASVLMFPCRLLLEFILFITGLARHPLFYRPVYPPGVAGLVLIYGLLVAAAALYYRYRRRRQLEREYPIVRPQSPDTPRQNRSLIPINQKAFFPRKLLLFTSLGLTVLLLWGSVLLPSRSSSLEVTFLDVGQGAAALVEAPGGTTILIDGGGEPPHRGDPGRTGEMVLLPYLRRQGVRRIDLAVVSHPHEDHFGGMLPLVEEIPVKTLLLSPVPGESPYYDLLLERAAARGLSIEKVGAGRCWSSSCGLRIGTLGPPAELFTGSGSDLNNSSLVLRLDYGTTSFLFCGDIEDDAARELLRQKANLRAEVLLIPHHGGFMAALPDLLAAVQPRYAVISVGPNNFGHPHPDTLVALEAAGVEVLRTDRHGSIIMKSNGSELNVKRMQESVEPIAGR